MQQPPRRPARRPMTRAQYEALLARRRREKILSIALLAVIVTLIVVAIVLILRPKPDAAREAVAAVSAAQTPAAGEAEPTTAPEATEEPAATAAPAVIPSIGTPNADGLRSVRFRVTGDIMVTEDQLYYAFDAAGRTGFDFGPQFALIAESLSNADFTMGNLETTIGMYNGKNYSGYPMFNSPESLLDALRDAGYDFFTLANNHMLDRWFDGMKNTVTWVEQYGFGHVGAYRTQAERDTPTILEINGIKFGFVAYTHTTNTMENACDKDAQVYGVPYLYRSDIETDVKRVRDAGAEVVIAFPHWGEEYVRTPDSNQGKYAKKLAMAGVDIILGSHSHMVQPMFTANITANDGVNRNVFAISSLGNFLSTHTMQYTDSGIILEFTVSEQPDGSFAVENIGYVPTYCWIHDNTVQILSSAKYLDHPPEGMDEAAYKRMKETYYETIEVLGDQYAVLQS